MKLSVDTLSDDHLCAELARARELVLLLDLDGTIIPFAPTVEEADLDEDGRDLLRRLCHVGVRVVVVSGRPRAMVEKLCPGLDDVWWMAEHGTWRRGASGEWEGPTPASEVFELTRLFEPFLGVPGVKLEPKTTSLCVHWRLVPIAEKADVVTRCELASDEWLESHPDFERLDGAEMLEVRLRSANKERAVTWVHAHFPDARIIAIGDDHTDEDMFAALGEDDLAIGVGPERAHVHAWLPGPGPVRAFLAWLVEVRVASKTMPPAPIAGRPARRPGPTPLLVVSNRTPAASTGRHRQVGGLVSALEPALERYDGMWLGWSGNEREGERKLVVDPLLRPARASFDFPPSWREHFYGGLCNRALWPLFHGFPVRVRYSDLDWRAYVDANDEFGRHAYELAAPDGMVWMHDYHLLLAGRALRRRGFRGPIGMFVHIPFPQSDLLDTVPWADQLLEAMLDFDLVAFHTEQWASNFRGWARSRGATGALPDIAVLPIGVDPAPFELDRDAIDPDIAGLRDVLGDRRLVLGVDRLDYAKGIPERLLAFERLLESTPTWRRQVSFVQVSVPSRAEVPEYAELRHTVENLVGRINGRFGEADWVPVRYLYRSYDHRVLAQLYRLADVALVTPLRDGLNLVAKEFVVSQEAADPGVLVLSRFAGAAAELRDAVLTNPLHVDGLAGDIDHALRMSLQERVQRHAALRAALADRTPQRWAAAFLDRLSTAQARAKVPSDRAKPPRLEGRVQ